MMVSMISNWIKFIYHIRRDQDQIMPQLPCYKTWIFLYFFFETKHGINMEFIPCKKGSQYDIKELQSFSHIPGQFHLYVFN